MDGEHAAPALVGHALGRVERRGGPPARHHLLELEAEAALRLRVGVRVAGVVDQDVEPSARRPGNGLEPTPHRGGVGHVADEGTTGEGGAERGELVVHGARGGGAQIVHADMGAGAREREGDLTPEAGAGASHERNLPVEVGHRLALARSRSARRGALTAPVERR